MPSSSTKKKQLFHGDASSTIVTSSVHGDEHWMERATGKMSRGLTKLLNKTGACARMCSVYVEEQVAYENRQDTDYVTSMDRIMTGVTGARSAAGAASSILEVDLYRQFLFDEESVMESFYQVDEHPDHAATVAAIDGTASQVPAPSESGVGDVFLNHHPAEMMYDSDGETSPKSRYHHRHHHHHHHDASGIMGAKSNDSADPHTILTQRSH